jgi:type III pantothenate kinase
MKPRVVVDVGNTRIKWGLCTDQAVESMVSLPCEESDWVKQIKEWGIDALNRWTVAGVHPDRRDHLVGWLRERKFAVSVLTGASELPMSVALEAPEKVGIDRLLNALAVLGQKDHALPAIIISVGSAVTVDWLNEKGEFGGGAIFPGFRLMAKALHDYTALLPEIEVRDPQPPLPGTSTVGAMQAGIYWAVEGGIASINAQFVSTGFDSPSMYITGGDADLILPSLAYETRHWPEMTLEGIRLASAQIS